MAKKRQANVRSAVLTMIHRLAILCVVSAPSLRKHFHTETEVPPASDL